MAGNIEYNNENNERDIDTFQDKYRYILFGYDKEKRIKYI
jgi:hypothetical protein